MRFMEGLTGLVNAMNDATALFKEVESLGFRHLEIDVTSFLAKLARIFQEMSLFCLKDGIGLCGCYACFS